MSDYILHKDTEHELEFTQYMDKMTGVKGFPTEVKGPDEWRFYTELEKQYRNSWKKHDDVDFCVRRCL